MESDLISRQAAIDAIVNTVSEIGLHDNSEVARYGATFMQHEIIDIIEGMPSAQPYTDEEIQKMQDIEQAQFDKIRELAYQEGKADAMAEIIRCRDCKLRDTEYCNMAHGFMGMKDDDYCSYAERREVSE